MIQVNTQKHTSTRDPSCSGMEGGTDGWTELIESEGDTSSFPRGSGEMVMEMVMAMVMVATLTQLTAGCTLCQEGAMC